MTILQRTPVTLAEVQSIVKNLEEKKDLKEYLKKFVKLSKEKVDALTKQIRELNNPKIKEKDVVKIADFLPETHEELNKVFTEVSLSEEETNAILNITKKY